MSPRYRGPRGGCPGAIISALRRLLAGLGGRCAMSSEERPRGRSRGRVRARASRRGVAWFDSAPRVAPEYRSEGAVPPQPEVECSSPAASQSSSQPSRLASPCRPALSPTRARADRPPPHRARASRSARPRRGPAARARRCRSRRRRRPRRAASRSPPSRSQTATAARRRRARRQRVKAPRAIRLAAIVPAARPRSRPASPPAPRQPAEAAGRQQRRSGRLHRSDGAEAEGQALRSDRGGLGAMS